jgi:hypothetical protein
LIIFSTNRRPIPGVSAGSAQDQDKQTGVDGADDGPAHLDTGASHPLQQRNHRPGVMPSV